MVRLFFVDIVLINHHKNYLTKYSKVLYDIL